MLKMGRGEHFSGEVRKRCKQIAIFFPKINGCSQLIIEN